MPSSRFRVTKETCNENRMFRCSGLFDFLKDTLTASIGYFIPADECVYSHRLLFNPGFPSSSLLLANQESK
jgi:hypothetical protein